MPEAIITLGLLFPWMNRDYVLYQMTFPEMMLYYSIGVEQHLKLSGLYCGDETTEKPAIKPPVLDESADHQAIWEYYHNQQFDPKTWENLVNGK